MKRGRVKVKADELPKKLKGYHCVYLLKGIFVDEGPEGDLWFDELIYTWNYNADDRRVICWLGNSDREIGEAKNLQDAIKLALEDYQDLIRFMPEKRIKVIE